MVRTAFWQSLDERSRHEASENDRKNEKSHDEAIWPHVRGVASHELCTCSFDNFCFILYAYGWSWRRPYVRILELARICRTGDTRIRPLGRQILASSKIR